MVDLPKLRRTAAEILAVAVYEMFPGVELWGGGDTRSGFYYDFFFPHPIHPELHFQIEEKMRQIAREKRDIKDLEMVAVSAKEFLKSKGHAVRAKHIDGDGLFNLVQIGSFTDITSGDHLSNTSQLVHFKLFPPIPLEDRGMRIAGSAQDTKEHLKEFLKKWATYPRKRHEKIGEAKQFWAIFDGEFVWLQKGLEVKDKLLACLHTNLCHGVVPNILEVACPQSADRTALHKKIFCDMGVDAVIEISPLVTVLEAQEDVGLLNPEEGKEIQITTSLKNITSFLQSIAKTLTILGFSYTIRLVGTRRKERGYRSLFQALENLGWSFDTVETDEEDRDVRIDSRVDFLVADGLGRTWNAANMTAKEFVVVQVLVERNLALLLELQEFGHSKFLI